MQANKERAAEIALCCALTCVAGAADADFFAGWQFAVPVVGGAAVPALLVAIATQRAWRPGRAALVGVLLLPVAGAALLLVLPGTGVSSVGDAARTVVDGTVDGWAAMLAAGLPADLHGDLLVTPLALSWLASLASCLLAVHTRGPIVPVGPPTAALAASLALTGEAASDRLALAAAFLGLALVLVLVRANGAVATALTEALPGAGALPGGAPELAERGPAPYPGRPGRVRCTPRRGDRDRRRSQPARRARVPTRGRPAPAAVPHHRRRRLQEPGAGGAITVTEADSHAWPEVHLEGLGRVPIEATGRRTDSAPEPDDVQAPPGRPSSAPSDASRPARRSPGDRRGHGRR